MREGEGEGVVEVKCMLGYRNSASDMAYLNARAWAGNLWAHGSLRL